VEGPVISHQDAKATTNHQMRNCPPAWWDLTCLADQARTVVHHLLSIALKALEVSLGQDGDDHACSAYEGA